MNLQTFTGTTMIECLAQVKAAMGANAVILHTRSYRRRLWLGLRKREFVEITAGRGMSGPDRRKVAPSGSINPQAARPRAAAGPLAAYLEAPASKNIVLSAGEIPVAASAGNALGQGRATVFAQPGEALLQQPAVQGVIGGKVAKDVEELKELVAGLVQTMHKKDAPNVPEELFEYYLKLVQNQVAEELAGDIIRALRKQIRPEYISNAQFVKDKIADHIEKLIPTAGPIVRKKTSGPHVVALIGPTGVGKTTTIAKLAANLKLREKRKVGLITLDTYRIAAIEQLKKYADILDSSLRVVTTAEELRDAVTAMHECEFVLIDTAGRSPRDSMKIGELKTMLAAANPDEVHLVLSTTASESCVELAVERFAEVPFDKIIFTKLDEAASVGVVLNVITRLNKALSYVTTGQDVPDDIEVGQGRRLAQRILESNA